MDEKLLQHLLALAGKTGDRIVVVHPATNQPFVIMGLSQYEDLVDRTVVSAPEQSGEGVSVQRVNEDIAAWRAVQPPAVTVPEVPVQEHASPVSAFTMGGFVPEPLQSATIDDDQFYVEPIE